MEVMNAKEIFMNIRLFKNLKWILDLFYWIIFVYDSKEYSEREKMCERIQNLNFINNMIK